VSFEKKYFSVTGDSKYNRVKSLKFNLIFNSSRFLNNILEGTLFYLYLIFLDYE